MTWKDSEGAFESASAYIEDRANDPGLRHLVDGLARDTGFLDGCPNWVVFLSDDAYIEAEVKQGFDAHVGVLSIDAYLLRTEETLPREGQVREWIDRQPKPPLGMLTVGTREREDGEIEFLPLLSVDARVDSILAEFVRDELIFPFAEAWDAGAAAVLREPNLGGGDGAGGVYRHRPVEIEPRNAWLLIGDEASYPTPDDLREEREHDDAGIFDYEWTAPKNGELGDLALIYFTAPRKAAHFVTRLASRPYWQTDLEVNALKGAERHQWWATITIPVEIEPIPFQTLQEAAGGHLPLRGRSGHYLSPQVVKALTFVAKDPEQQAEVDRIAQVPTGNPDLPRLVEDLDHWKAIPGGALPLEAKVSEHVVLPLLERLVFRAPYSRAEDRLDMSAFTALTPEYRVPSGFVDFVFDYAFRHALAVEVKLTVLRPVTGVWADSVDFRQLQRYMGELGVPGLLVDAQRILLVRPNEDAPFAEIVRAEATWDDIALIRNLILDGQELDAAPSAEPSPSGHPIPPVRRVKRRG